MSKQRDRDEFVQIMSREVPVMPLSAIYTLMRAGRTLHRLAELECSSEAADRDQVPCPNPTAEHCVCEGYGSRDGTQHGTVPRIAVRELQTHRRVNKLCHEYGISARFSNDPRGAVLVLAVPSGFTNDWGKTGVCVP